MPTNQERLGALLVLAGLVGLVLTIFDIVPSEPGAAAAVSMFLVMLGLVFTFPSMLTDDTGLTSTMRVAVFMIVSLFVVLTIKAGWGATSLEELVLPSSWSWVLAAALGGKAAQSFAENATPTPLAGDKSQRAATRAPAKSAPTRSSTARDEDAGIEDTP